MTKASLTNDDIGLLVPALAFIIISLWFPSVLERSHMVEAKLIQMRTLVPPININNHYVYDARVD